MLAGKMQRTILMAIFLFASLSLAETNTVGTNTTAQSVGTNSVSPIDTAVASSGDSNRIFDFKLRSDMKTADLEDPKSALSKLIAFVVKGAGKISDYVAIVQNTKGSTEIKLEIHDDSIFVPGNDPKNTQNGFRRTDVLPAIDKNKTQSGVTTWYQTIRLDSKAKLVLSHGYLLASIEVSSGDHIFDIFTGSDFKSENTEHKPTPNSQTIRVRDMATTTLLSLPLTYDQNYNFAVTVDWTNNMLSVYSSINAEPLKMSGGKMQNADKAKSFKQQGEYHLQLIKMPLPDPKDPIAKRSDTPHSGIQEPIKKEHVFFSNVFVTSGDEIVQPKFTAFKPKSKKAKSCKRRASI